jgi:sigma-B regulation protein RsbU (phosphoserine phosphatase)
MMTVARAVLRVESTAQPAPTPETILSSANEKLLADFAEAGMFVTAFVGQYHPSSRELVYASAGHSPVIFHAAGGPARLLEADGPPLGVLRESLACNRRIFLKSGDILVAATDGLSEARSPRREYFGLGRLLAQVHHLQDQSAVGIAGSLLAAVRDFSAPEPQADDQTVVILRCTGC